MAIISANRMSSMNGNYVIAANESYGVEDMGRILMENEINDMNIFNAMLKNDMYELKCRTEGTLLESELVSLTENAVKDLFHSIAEKLKKFWAKMKGYFQKAYSMITALCVRNGKAFLKANKKAISELTNDVTIDGEHYSADRFEDAVDKSLGGAERVKNIVKFADDADSSRGDMTKKVLKFYLGDKYDGEKTVFEYMKDTYFTKLTDATLSAYGGKSKLTADIESGMSTIKDLKKTEKVLEGNVKQLIKDAQRKAANAAKDLEGEAKDKMEKEAQFWRVASTAITNGMSAYIKSLTKAVKFRLTQERIVLAKAIGAKTHVESTLMESMIRELVEDVENLDDDTVTDADMDKDDIEEIKDAMLSAVEEALKDEENSVDNEYDDED